jgi:putative MATE family efflux protein
MEPELEPRLGSELQRTLSRQFLPMLGALLFVGSTGIISIAFVSMLGATALAVVSTALPIIVAVNQLWLGYGVAVTSTIARAHGAGDEAGRARLIFHTFLLGLTVALAVAAALTLARPALLAAMNVDVALREPLSRFLLAWMPSIAFFFCNAWGTAALRALGDAMPTAVSALLQALLTLLLTPLLIFGLGPLRPLGVHGAALAVTLAALGAALVTFYYLVRCPHWTASFALKGLRSSLQATLAIALPAILTFSLAPITSAVLTSWLAPFGPAAVAAFGVAGRFEACFNMFPLAIGGALGPYVGARFGAREFASLRAGTSYGRRLATRSGAGVGALTALSAVPVANALANEPALRSLIVCGLLLTALGFVAQANLSVASTVYNNVGRALTSTRLSLLQVLVLALPFAALGQRWLGVYAIYMAQPLSSIVTERLASAWLRHDGFAARALRT